MPETPTDAVQDEVWKRAGGKCECTMTTCGHMDRCNVALEAHKWHMHRLTAGGAYVASNIRALCIPCHENTPTYGAGKR